MQFFLLAITDALPGKNQKLRSDNIFFHEKMALVSEEIAKIFAQFI